MKKILFSTVLLCLAFAAVQAQAIKLPSECRNLLNKSFRGWKTTTIRKEVAEVHRASQISFTPNLIKGDWNGDGKVDYAVLIEHRKDSKTIAFVRVKNKFRHFVIEGGDYIQVFKKGVKDYNYNSQKKFSYKNDSIFVGVGCCGSSYVWKSGKFIGFVTSD